MVPVRWRRIRIEKGMGCRSRTADGGQRTRYLNFETSAILVLSHCKSAIPLLTSTLHKSSFLVFSALQFLILLPLRDLAGIDGVSVSHWRFLVRQRHTLSSKPKHGCSAFSSSSRRALFLQNKTGPIGISPYWFGMCCSSFWALTLLQVTATRATSEERDYSHGFCFRFVYFRCRTFWQVLYFCLQFLEMVHGLL